MKIAPQFPDEQADDGSFVRQQDAFRDWVRADGSSSYPVQAGRYHLYVSLACPWASRIVILRYVALSIGAVRVHFAGGRLYLTHESCGVSGFCRRHVSPR